MIKGKGIKIVTEFWTCADIIAVASSSMSTRNLIDLCNTVITPSISHSTYLVFIPCNIALIWIFFFNSLHAEICQ